MMDLESQSRKVKTQRILISSAAKWPLVISKRGGSQGVVPWATPISSASLENL